MLSAVVGVSPQHSFWSTYSRMQGIVNAAHWAAFALVVASVARRGADWTRLLNLNLAVGLAVAVLAMARYAAPEGPLLLVRRARRGAGRASARRPATPILLGAYLQAVALLALGFLVRSWALPAAPVVDGAGVAGGAAARGAPGGASCPGRRLGGAAVLGGDGRGGARRASR